MTDIEILRRLLKEHFYFNSGEGLIWKYIPDIPLNEVENNKQMLNRLEELFFSNDLEEE